MVTFSHSDFLNYEAKTTKAFKKSNPEAASRETGKGGLQQKIMDWCDAQWPKWVYDFPRTDLKSTLPLGRHDATIWGPFPRCYLIETKAKGGKLSEDQRIWITRMKAIKWEVRVIFSIEDFIEFTKTYQLG